MGYSPDRLAEFTAHFHQGLGEWARAMETGDTARLEPEMADEIVCYFGRAGVERMEVLRREEIVAGMRSSVQALRGCRKRFENVIIRMRSDEEAVVFFEQVVERADQVLARLFTIETYRRDRGRWLCVREVAEHTGA